MTNKWLITGTVAEPDGMEADIWADVESDTMEEAMAKVRAAYPRIVFNESKRADEIQ